MNKFYKKIAIAPAVLAVLFLAGCQLGDLTGGGVGGEIWLDEGEVNGPSVTLHTSKGNFIIDAEIADTMEQRTQGLMHRTEMKDNHGMFFVFDREEQLSFWMKNTLIPLDMIFFDSNHKVVHIQRDAQPCKKDPCEVFSSVKPAKYVLEMKAGTADRLEVKEGDSVEVNI